MNDSLKIELSQHYLTGIPGIDAQHKDFFLLFDGFLNSLKKGEIPHDIVQAVIQEILEHLKSHFFTEESLMEMVAFPKAGEHKARHENFLNLVAEERKIFSAMDNLELGHFLCSYRHILHVHISVYDREYVNFIGNITKVKKKFNVSTLEAGQAIAG